MQKKQQPHNKTLKTIVIVFYHYSTDFVRFALGEF
jgi:hypothetical protein